jgi:outer membrane receptor protein involved in Fe transport
MEQCRLKSVTQAVVGTCKLSAKALRRAALIASVSLSASQVRAATADATADAAAAAGVSAIQSQQLADVALPAATQIESVTVTARKSSELLQDVPVSISAIRADTMLRQNTVSLRELFAQIPGLSLGARSGGRNEIALRGIVTGFATNPTTATTIDDTPFGASTLAGQGGSMQPDLDPFDLQRIEVLRGPQGTLYGASSLGGLIKYVTVAPNTSRLEGKVQVDGARTAHGGNGYGQRAALNIPLIADTLAMRLSVFQRQDPGFVDDPQHGGVDVDAVHARGGRLSAIWYATPELTVRASALTQRSRAASSSTVDYVAGRPVDGQYRHSSLPDASGYDRTIHFYDLTVTDDLRWATLTSVTSLGLTRFSGDQDLTETFSNTIRGLLPALGYTMPAGGLGIGATGPNRVRKLTQELRLESPPDAGHTVDWRAGLFYTRESSANGQNISLRDINSGVVLADRYPLLSASTSRGSYKEYAAFGTVTYHFTPRFDVQTGGRYGHNAQSNRRTLSGPLNLAGSTTDNASEGKFTYLVTPRYRFSADLMTYATLSSGYRPGGANTAATGIPSTYRSDSTVNLELGLKGQFLHRALALNAALFHIRWDDLQLMGVDPATSYSYYTNSSGAKSEGLELTSEWRPLAGLAVTGSATFTHAVLTADAPPGVYGFTGDRLPYSARKTATLGINRNFTAAGYNAYAGATLSYMGERVMDFQKTAATPRYTFGGFATLNLQAGVVFGRWTLGAFIKNAGDRVAFLGGSSRNQFDQLTGTRSYHLITPRTAGMSLSASF